MIAKKIRSIILLSLQLIFIHLSGQTSLNKIVVSNGGQAISGTNYKANLTIGQGLVAKSQTEKTQANIGFWYIPEQGSTEPTTKAKIKINVEKQKTPVFNPINELKIYPNPFYSKATAEFQVGKNGRVRLVLIDMNGSIVSYVMDEMLTAGRYKVPLKAQGLSNALYNLVLVTDGKQLYQRFMVLN